MKLNTFAYIALAFTKTEFKEIVYKLVYFCFARQGTQQHGVNRERLVHL